MKIAVLNWRDEENPAAGGAELFVHEVGSRWARLGHSVTLITSRHRGGARRSSSDGIEVVRVGNLRDGSHHLLSLGAVRKLAPVDLLLESVSTIPYWTPIRRTHATSVVTLVHQLARDVWKSHLRLNSAANAVAWLEHKLYLPYRLPKSGVVAAVSESTRQDLISAGVMYVSVVPQGGVGPQPQPEKETRPTLIYVARLTPNKRPDHALTAFELVRQSIPDCRMWVVGEGSMKAALVARRPEGVSFFGRLPRSELMERMGRAHLLLATSVREGWGLAVTEANAVGTPAVAYDVHGLRDSVKDEETGLLVDQNPQNLANAARQLLENPQRYAWLRKKAVEWGQSLSWDRTAEALLELAREGNRPLEETKIDERA